MTKRTLYGRTPAGQQLYDFGFSKLTEKWLARKYRMPIAEVRRLKAVVREALTPQRKKRKSLTRRRGQK